MSILLCECGEGFLFFSLAFLTDGPAPCPPSPASPFPTPLSPSQPLPNGPTYPIRLRLVVFIHLPSSRRIKSVASVGDGPHGRPDSQSDRMMSVNKTTN